MRRFLLPCCLASAFACGTSTPSTTLGAEDEPVTCESMRGHVQAIYREASQSEGVAANLSSEFVSANVHMVMADCVEAPERVRTCVRDARSARQIESECLLPLDDEGTVEGQRFARRG